MTRATTTATAKAATTVHKTTRRQTTVPLSKLVALCPNSKVPPQDITHAIWCTIMQEGYFVFCYFPGYRRFWGLWRELFGRRQAVFLSWDDHHLLCSRSIAEASLARGNSCIQVTGSRIARKRRRRIRYRTHHAIQAYCATKTETNTFTSLRRNRATDVPFGA